MLVLLLCRGGGSSMTMPLAERLWESIGRRGVRSSTLYSQFSAAQRPELDQILTSWLRAGVISRDLGVLERTPKAADLEYDEMMASSGLAATRGVPARTDVMPVEYETACKAIATCLRLDEAKQWGDKAEALAVWARIYQDDKVSIEARRLKLHAYRRMSQLAEELAGGARGVGAKLREAGCTPSQATIVRGVGVVPRRMFDKAVAAAKPPTPSNLARVINAECPDWERVKRPMAVLVSIVAKHPPVALADKLPDLQLSHARRLVAELREWMAKFDRGVADREERAA